MFLTLYIVYLPVKLEVFVFWLVSVATQIVADWLLLAADVFLVFIGTIFVML